MSRRKHSRNQAITPGKGTFNPEDENYVKHTKMGVWDLYQETRPELAYIPGASRVESYLEMYQSLPFVWKMMKDIGGIRSCWVMLTAYLSFSIMSALVPAVSLWYSGQLLKNCMSPQCLSYHDDLSPLFKVEFAVDQRTVDTALLFQVAGGRVACTITARLLSHCIGRVQVPLNKRIKRYYSTHIFHAMARLDVPTFDDPAVQRQMESAWSATGRSSVCWDTVQMVMGMMGTLIRLLSQVSVLVAVLRDQRDGPLLAVLSFGESIFQWISARRRFIDSGGKLI